MEITGLKPQRGKGKKGRTIVGSASFEEVEEKKKGVETISIDRTGRFGLFRNTILKKKRAIEGVKVGGV